MKKTSRPKSFYRGIGIVFMLIAILMFGLTLFPTERQVLELNWLFYLLVGLVYYQPSWLVKLIQTNPYVEWFLAVPAILGILVVILGDMGKLPVAIELDMLPVILYCTSFSLTMEKGKKENGHEKE